MNERNTPTLSDEEWPAPPKILYRYMPLADLKYVVQGKLKFSSPSSFNDPFDCQLFPRFSGTHADYLAFVDNKLKQDGMNREARRRELLRLSPVLDSDLFEEAFRNTAAIKQRGVLCFSEEKSDILMWAHYAEKHTGLCLGFDMSFDFFGGIRPVNYSKSYPTQNLLPMFVAKDQKSQRTLTRFVFLTKSEHWTYEKEWRLVVKPPGIHSFPTESVCEIYFGCQAPEDKVMESLKVIESLKNSPQIFRAKVSKTEFALDFIEVKDGRSV